MKKEKTNLYGTFWNTLASGMEYSGIFLGATAIYNGLFNLYINSQKFLQKTDLREIIDGYTTTALVGGLMFVAGSIINNLVRKQETNANNTKLEQIIDSRLESYQNRVARELSNQRSYLIAYTKALEKALEQVSGETHSEELERNIGELKSMHSKLIDSNPPSKDKVYQEAEEYR